MNGDTSCMKAPYVKGDVFAVVFSLSRAILRGRGGHGCLEDRILTSPFVRVLVFRPGAARDVLSS